MFFNLPNSVKNCIETIESHGFEAWCVGGAVRDHIMNVTPGDYDVTTNALPDDIIAMFQKTVPTGIKHGTVTVIIDNLPIEVTTYRTENGYFDHRKPDNVQFVTDINNDLLRRDFTMNAICYHHKKGIFDILGGINDINNKTIRAVGEPHKRFTEDALRILRAFRFSCQLGFLIEENTFNAALDNADSLELISVERIAAELKKAIVSKYPKNISPLLKHNVFNTWGFNNTEIKNNFDNIPFDFAFRFAIICNENNLDSDLILTNLKFDNKTKLGTKTYCQLLKMPCDSSKDIRRMLSVSDIEHTRNFINAFYPEKSKILNEIINNKEPFKISMLNIDGEMLLKLGIKGEKVGTTLAYLLEKVIDDPTTNNREILLELAKLI